MDRTSAQLQALTRRLDALEDENRALRDRAEPKPPEPDSSSISRRRMMLGGGAAALGALAATSASSPAAAGALNPLNREVDNTVNRQTSISGDVRRLTRPGGDTSNIFTSALFTSNENPNVGTALYGVAQSFGVAGLASNDSGTGVFGRSEAGSVGVHGFTYGDAGSSPATQFTSGVWGQISSEYPTSPAFLADGQITLRGMENPGGVPTSTGAEAGDLSIRRQADDTATWWVCVKAASGTADAEFVRLAAPDATGALEPLPAPLRVYDSRSGELPATGPKEPLATGSDRVVDCTLNTDGAVPQDARAVLINLAATQSSAPGFLAAHSSDVTWTGTANLNFALGQDVSNSVTVRCDEGRISIRAGGPPGTVHFVVDVIGFYR